MVVELHGDYIKAAAIEKVDSLEALAEALGFFSHEEKAAVTQIAQLIDKGDQMGAWHLMNKVRENNEATYNKLQALATTRLARRGTDEATRIGKFTKPDQDTVVGTLYGADDITQVDRAA